MLDAEDAIDASGIAGHVVFEDVRFAYDASRQILDGISFQARPGELVALVGLTGAGKTTIASLIPRFFEPTSGRVLIDGVDVSRYGLRSLRERIAVVPQEPVLFSGSIGDNIRYGRLEATDEEVAAAARVAHVDHFIRRLPDGYDTPVAEAARTLSGGERQRLGIARARAEGRADPDPRRADLRARRASPRRPCSRRCGPCARAAPSSSSRTGCRPSATPTASSCCTRAGSSRRARTTSCCSPTSCTARMCARLSVGKSLDEPESVDEVLKALA